MAVDDKPLRAEGYEPARTDLARRACLEIATRLGDFREELCVVGGLVPGLLVPAEGLSPGEPTHVGTYDLDLGLSVAVLSEQRYEEIAARLREAGFAQDTNPAGRRTSQRWRSPQGALVDFLIPPASDSDQPGRLRNMDQDFAAIITPGLHLAFHDRESVRLEGPTLTGGVASRSITVCGPGAFLVLKALAFRNRGQNKDAYDLFYVLRNRPDAGTRLRSLADDAHAGHAVGILREDFARADGVGPRRVAEFLRGGADDDVQADVAGLVRALLREIG